jgi:signal transduction histidine kinase
MLSHELRNPLAPLKNSLYVLQRAAPGGEQAKRALAVMARQVGQLGRLVGDLLDVTRISRSKLLLQRQRLDLNELVPRAVDDHRAIFEEHGLRLDTELAPAAVFVHADRQRLSQVVGNLLQNAAKFTSRGGSVRISVAADLTAQAPCSPSPTPALASSPTCSGGCSNRSCRPTRFWLRARAAWGWDWRSSGA